MSHPAHPAFFNDQRILLAAQMGDLTAGNALRGQFDPLLRKMLSKTSVRHNARRPDFVDDVLGETYRMILDPKVKRFSPTRGNPRSYLFGLVCNAVRIVARQRRPVRVAPEDRPGLSIGSSRSACIVHAQMMTPDSDMDTSWDIEKVREALFNGGNPTGEQMALAYYVEGESQVVIGKRWGVSHTTVGRRIQEFKADAKLRLASVGAA